MMKGLLIKDFKLTLKTGFIYYGISILFLLCEIINIFNDDNFVKVISVSAIVMSTVILSYITPLIMYADEKYGWDKYEKLLPISKKIIVAEKYIFPYLILAAYSIINAAIITWAYNKHYFNIYGVGSFMSNFIKSFFIGMIIPCISIPLCIKFGYLKSKYIKLAIMLIAIFALYTNLSNYVIGDEISKVILNSINSLSENRLIGMQFSYEIKSAISMAINALAILIINIISYLVSLSFYRSDKK
ncbi:MAG: ABC-2 transporter permease [Eubacterium sp.]|nr:ABC-2 transporter permease [Eubacterium sp.]